MNHLSGVVVKRSLVVAWAVCEAGWFRHSCQTADYINEHPPPVIKPQERRPLLHNMKESLETTGLDLPQYIAGWYSGAPASAICASDVRSFWSMVCFGKSNFGSLSAAEVAELDCLIAEVDDLERYAGDDTAAGSAGAGGPPSDAAVEDEDATGKKLINPSEDPLPWIHHPLVWYAGIGLLQCVGDLFMLGTGFRRQPLVQDEKGSHLDVWIRKADKAATADAAGGSGTPASASAPVVFLHGIGVGLWPYFPILFRLPRDVDAYVADVKSLSMSITRAYQSIVDVQLGYPDPPKPTTFVPAIRRMLEQNGHHQACFVGHSFGCALTTWLLRFDPGVVQSFIQVDPVPILATHPDLCYNALYKFQLRPRILITRELMIAYTMMKANPWYTWCMWPHKDLDLQKQRTRVFLSEGDDLLPAERVKRYLGSVAPTIPVKMWPSVRHGAWLIFPQYVGDVLDAVDECRRLPAHHHTRTESE